jgi:Arc/MetJ-type ribon-helix-helix transcriptional regulator
MDHLNVRFPEDLARQLEEAVSQRGFSSASALVRYAVQNELHRRETAVAKIEERIAGSLNTLASEVRSVHTAHMATFALVDALAKVILTCLPEPPTEVAEQARSRAKRRYQKFLVSVAQGMTGESKGALRELSRANS